MSTITNRRAFLRTSAFLSFSALAGNWLGGASARAAFRPVRRIGGAHIKIALNAYSFSKVLNDHAKGRGPGISLLQLLDFCARHDFDGFDPTGYFFPGYPQVPPDEYVNNLKRRAFDLGIGISGTGVRNNFTTADKAARRFAPRRCGMSRNGSRWRHDWVRLSCACLPTPRSETRLGRRWRPEAHATRSKSGSRTACGTAPTRERNSA
jgi:hypothetical protein